MKVWNRLWVRLTLAFTLVILVAVGAIALLISWTTDVEFRQYITHSDMRASGSGIQQLAAYYEQAGNWDGVESLLANGIRISRPMGMFPFNREPGFGMFLGQVDALLADADGKVVFDSTGQATGKRLSARDRNKALSITALDGDQIIGYLLLSIPGREDIFGELEQRFMDRIQRAMTIGAAVAVGLGLLAGALLSRSLTAPLQRLAAAVRAVAGGNLGQQVQVEGSAEIAEVGRAFNEMTTALEEGEKLRQDLVADVAHELRTPLSVLQGNLRAILDDVYPLEKAEIANLYDETRLLSRLVDDLRELAQAEAGQLSLNLRPTDVGDVVRTAVTHFAPAAEVQELCLTAEIAALPAIQADPDRLAQVLRNLLTNALRHTSQGDRIIVSATAVAGAVEIAVADSGEGIAPQDLPHVFDRFWRADRSRSRSEGGAGLGLAIARSLVQAHGGRIWAQSIKGEGSTFTLSLPIPDQDVKR